MSLFDAIKGELMKSAAGVLTGDPADPGAGGPGPAMADQVFRMVKEKGVGSLVDHFSKNGLGDVAASWVGTGENAPVSEEQIEQVLPADTISGIAAKLGIDKKMVITAITFLLPIIIDKLTPRGKVEEPEG